MSFENNRLEICLVLSEFYLAFYCVYEVNCIFVRIHFEYIMASLMERRKKAAATDFFPVDFIESNLLYHASQMFFSASTLSILLTSFRSGKKFAYFIFVSAQPWLRSLIHCRTSGWSEARRKWWTGKLICVVNHWVNRYSSSRAENFFRELSESREWAATSDGGASSTSFRQLSVWMWRNHIH